jgi:predicted amidohydrolase YtcJ
MAADDRWLLRGVQVDGAVVDCRIAGGIVHELRPGLEPVTGEHVIACGGAALLPGLADHHLHLFAAAAARSSVDLTGHADLASVPVPPGTGWLRLIGADSTLDRSQLDAVFPDRPVRAQHRSGALWTLNSAAIDRLAPMLDPAQRRTGQLWRSDDTLRAGLAARGESTQPDVPSLGSALARLGVTHVTDATPDLDAGSIAGLAASIPQHVLSLSAAAGGTGPVKIVVADSRLPTLPGLTSRIGAVHSAGRPVAVHAVTAAALVLTLAALTDAGPLPGDRIEHAAVCDDASADRIAALGVTVVSQPTLWERRGADFLRESPPDERHLLWRFRSLLERGVPMAVSSDAPYGDADPWRTIRAAATRRLADGPAGGPDERVPAEVALATLLTDPLDPAGPPRRVRPLGPADLVLLNAPLSPALDTVVRGDPPPVRTVFIAGVPHGGNLLDGFKG